MNFARNAQCLRGKSKGPSRDAPVVKEMKKGDWNCPQYVASYDLLVADKNLTVYPKKEKAYSYEALKPQLSDSIVS